MSYVIYVEREDGSFGVGFSEEKNPKGATLMKFVKDKGKADTITNQFAKIGPWPILKFKEVERNKYEQIEAMVKANTECLMVIKEGNKYDVMHSMYENPRMGGQGLKEDLSKSQAQALADKLGAKWGLDVKWFERKKGGPSEPWGKFVPIKAEVDLLYTVAEEIPDENFDSEELKKGIEAEKTAIINGDEHMAKQVAKSHMVQSPDYYTQLHIMEEEAERTKELIPVLAELEEQGKFKAAEEIRALIGPGKAFWGLPSKEEEERGERTDNSLHTIVKQFRKKRKNELIEEHKDNALEKGNLPMPVLSMEWELSKVARESLKRKGIKEKKEDIVDEDSLKKPLKSGERAVVRFPNNVFYIGKIKKIKKDVYTIKFDDGEVLDVPQSNIIGRGVKDKSVAPLHPNNVSLWIVTPGHKAKIKTNDKLPDSRDYKKLYIQYRKNIEDQKAEEEKELNKMKEELRVAKEKLENKMEEVEAKAAKEKRAAERIQTELQERIDTLRSKSKAVKKYKSIYEEKLKQETARFEKKIKKLKELQTKQLEQQKIQFMEDQKDALDKQRMALKKDADFKSPETGR